MGFKTAALAAAMAVSVTPLLANTAEASILTPGPGASLPDIFSITGATLLASRSETWTTATKTMSGTLVAAVYSDPGNTFGAGDLDFVYQVFNSAGSTDSVGRVTAINFMNWSTDVGYDPTGSALPGGVFVDGTVAPELVDRVSPGDSVGFSFNAPLTTLIAPGQTSTVLVIETNATHFGPGFANLIDGGVTSVAAFEPTASVPEPATWAMMMAGIFGLGALARRSRSRRINLA